MTTRPRSPGALRRALSAVAAGALALAGAVALPSSPARADTTTSGDVIANLWSYNWDSVASECADVLGPNGYGAVWVAPPAESLKQPNYYWWDVYQPYSYELSGRFGTAAEFASMVTACHAAGVKVYTDAVINHTAAQTGTGYNGTTITDKYDTPDWDPDDYHTSAECNDSDLIIDDWSNLAEIQNCELLGLPDLETEDDDVRSGIAAFLNKQIALGVDGFRVDAAKHMPVADLDAIRAKLTDTTSGAEPYVFQEVYPGSTPAASDYYPVGDVLDFTYASRVKSAFQGNVSDLESLPTSGVLPPADSVSFVTNHDTERNGLHMSYKDGDTYRLANVFQLAYKWSTPTVYSGFEFSSSDQAPPNSGGFVTDTNCSGGWYCLQRDTAVTGMVKWHNAVGAEAVTNWATKSSSVIGFGRGTAGYVAINNGSSAATYTFATGMADGTYANVTDSGATTVTVSGGNATLTIPAKSAIAFYDGEFTPCDTSCEEPDDGTDMTFNVTATTDWGTNVFVVGSLAALGSWNPADAIPLSSASYPKWSGSVIVPRSTAFEFKYIKKDGSGNVAWESGANRSYTTGSSPEYSTNDTWK